MSGLLAMGDDSSLYGPGVIQGWALVELHEVDVPLSPEGTRGFGGVHGYCSFRSLRFLWVALQLRKAERSSRSNLSRSIRAYVRPYPATAKSSQARVFAAAWRIAARPSLRMVRSP